MVSEMQKLRHDRLAIEQLYSDVKKVLVAEQSTREAKRERECRSSSNGPLMR